jgi:hypothetical protein
MPVAVFTGVLLLLGIVMTLLAYGASSPAAQIGETGVAAPPGYSFVYRFVGDVTGILRSDLPDEWICLGEGPTSPWTSCFAPPAGAIGGLTIDQLVAIGTLVVGVFSAVATLYVGLRGLRQDSGPSTNTGAG